MNAALDYGPLAPLLAERTVTEIMVNGPDTVFVERAGQIVDTDVTFASEQDLLDLMVRIAGTVGRTLDRRTPCVDCRLPDGSRVNCVIPPVSLGGPALTIRKFPAGRLTMAQLVTFGTVDLKLAHFLLACVNARINIVVSGGTGSGKTTFLNALSEAIGRGDRVVSIEDTAELKLDVPNWVRLEALAPTPNDPGVDIRDLVINALRMRPDRILVGECRGAEAFDMLTAMNTGHEGSMTTVHANGPRDCISRLETMVLLASTGMSPRVVREKISSGLQLVLHMARCLDGRRRVVAAQEIGDMHDQVVLTQEICNWSETGGFAYKGLVPGFVQLFEERGVPFPRNYFSADYVPPPLGEDLA